MHLKGQKGFTLVEITLVIVMLAILSATMIVPGDLTGHRAAVAAQKLAADLHYAQNLANTQRIRHGIEVTTSSSYRVFQDNGGSGTTITSPMTGGPYIVNMTGDFKGVTLSTTLGGTPPKSQFDSIGRPFDGNGASIGVGSNTIDLLATGTVIKTITIVPNTGMIQVN